MSIEPPPKPPRAPPTAPCPRPKSRGTPCHAGLPPPDPCRPRPGRTHRSRTQAFASPTLSGPSPVPSHPPPNFPHAPPVFTGPPSSLHSRAAQTAWRMAQIDRWPSHFATWPGLICLARRAHPRGARTSLGHGPSPRAGAPLAPACAPLRTGGAPHFVACAPLPKPQCGALNRVARSLPCHHAGSARRIRSPGTESRRRTPC